MKDICQNCGLPNVAWSAPDELWDRICKKEELLCPRCFCERAKEILPENEGIGFKAEIFYK